MIKVQGLPEVWIAAQATYVFLEEAHAQVQILIQQQFQVLHWETMRPLQKKW